MCGRFFQHAPRDEIAAAFSARPTFEAELGVRYNVAPGQAVLIVRHSKSAAGRVLEPVVWGLIPSFATDRKIGASLINARGETADTQPSFRSAFERRRCLVPADGFYEWRRVPGKNAKQPYAVARRDGARLAMAGLWEQWVDPSTGEVVRSCTVITTDANDLVAKLHDRMPVILPPECYARWLGEEPSTPSELKSLLVPFDPEPMKTWAVSSRVGSPRFDDPALLEPVSVDDSGRRDDDDRQGSLF